MEQRPTLLPQLPLCCDLPPGLDQKDSTRPPRGDAIPDIGKLTTKLLIGVYYGPEELSNYFTLAWHIFTLQSTQMNYFSCGGTLWPEHQHWWNAYGETMRIFAQVILSINTHIRVPDLDIRSAVLDADQLVKFALERQFRWRPWIPDEAKP